MRRKKTDFNLEEIKVRWKKAALENCTGAPCVTTPPVPPFVCGTSTIADFDGNTYNTVLIGTQCWTKENLKVTKYNDGTDIPLDATGGSNGTTGGQNWSSFNTGARTVHSNNNANLSIYGFLYNGYAAKGIATVGSTTFKNVCPVGWHVPIDSEWTILTNHLGGVVGNGGKLKSTEINYWTQPNVGADNSTGFSARGSSFRVNSGSFGTIKDEANFWTSTENGSNLWVRSLVNYHADIDKWGGNIKWGLAIRCLKD
jgi:uncharacterized protein (TIGR02145 family)